MTAFFEAAPIAYLRPPLIAAAWTAYLLMSVRVSNTYRPQPDYDEHAQSAA